MRRAKSNAGYGRQWSGLDFWGLLAPKPLGRGMIPLHPQWPAGALRQPAMSTRSVTHRCTLNHVPLARVSLTPHAAHPPAAARYFMTSSGGQAHDVTPAGRQGQNRQKFIDSHTVDESLAGHNDESPLTQ